MFRATTPRTAPAFPRTAATSPSSATRPTLVPGDTNRRHRRVRPRSSVEDDDAGQRELERHSGQRRLVSACDLRRMAATSPSRAGRPTSCSVTRTRPRTSSFAIEQTKIDDVRQCELEWHPRQQRLFLRSDLGRRPLRLLPELREQSRVRQTRTAPRTSSFAIASPNRSASPPTARPVQALSVPRRSTPARDRDPRATPHSRSTSRAPGRHPRCSSRSPSARRRSTSGTVAVSTSPSPDCHAERQHRPVGRRADTAANTDERQLQGLAILRSGLHRRPEGSLVRPGTHRWFERRDAIVAATASRRRR